MMCTKFVEKSEEREGKEKRREGGKGEMGFLVQMDDGSAPSSRVLQTQKLSLPSLPPSVSPVSLFFLLTLLRGKQRTRVHTREKKSAITIKKKGGEGKIFFRKKRKHLSGGGGREEGKRKRIQHAHYKGKEKNIFVSISLLSFLVFLLQQMDAENPFFFLSLPERGRRK